MSGNKLFIAAAALMAGMIAGAVLLVPALAGGDEAIDRAPTPATEEIPAFPDHRPVDENGSIAFVGPFGGEDVPWNERITDEMACLAREGLDEMPQSHDEVVALWEKKTSGVHYVYRDGGVFFDFSDPVVRQAFEACH